MKLLRIDIHGFKSFADKVTIDIKDGITGIVGPNGSGKSNIVDAVKWVLGEQSVKALRGGGVMSDVIFSGSKSRKPLTRAWVSLTFDNTNQYLKTDLREVEIKRVVYKSGENEYYLNNEIVRLKDITNLFIDSGSSVNSLSIISQGKIGEIINSRPEEKRSILEEAAGVLKYKKRKQETLRKLDKTNDNLSKINLIIDELTLSLEPLKKQAEVASKYLDLKKDLESTEIALIAHDIKELNEKHHQLKEKADTLDDQILTIDNSNIESNTKQESLKLKLLKIEESLQAKTSELYTLNNELSNLDAERKVMLERKKFEVEDSLLEENLINLKEKELSLKNKIKLMKEELISKEKELNDQQTKNEDLIKELKNVNTKRNLLLNELTNLTKEESSLKNKIDIINDNIESNSRLPFAVRKVLDNDRLKGIHNCLGKLIETEEKYSTTIDVSLGFLANVIVVDNENSARDAISYLKNNSLGRATFFPLNVIKPRAVDPNTLNKIKDDSSFISKASDLVKYNPIYRNVVLNQLGNIIVVDNLNNANRIGRLINYAYKIVTLDGELLAAGGAITGGTSKSNMGLNTQKFELENSIKLLKEKVKEVKLKEEEINDNNYNLKILENKVFDSVNNLNQLKETTLRRKSALNSTENELESIINEKKGTKGILNKNIDLEVDKLLKKYYEKKSKKENLELKIADENGIKNDLQSEISEIENNNKSVSANYNRLVKELNEIKIELSKTEIKLDNHLQRLNEEYSLTYEKASRDYILNEDIKEARTKVNSLKREIKMLGDVNTGSIPEYERINTRYTFLLDQKEDLNKSINDILNVIDELDITMEDRLKTTFKELNEEFGKVFNMLFKGGTGKLILEEPDDILNTGLDIIAEPPGKDIKNTRLLSGGESTLTAIALLFAILNIRTVPFCVLDEIEAALDEANVDMFGNYLKKLNAETQFIIVTHKKRTMEYTDNLYGVTMQESGVSKLVSVKLD
ncbi:MAG TPA: AAA family ATPase [Mollicutes bacterium]|nr:AAA family ATPase [Mollicutes bacterium]